MNQKQSGNGPETDLTWSGNEMDLDRHMQWTRNEQVRSRSISCQFPVHFRRTSGPFPVRFWFISGPLPVSFKKISNFFSKKSKVENLKESAVQSKNGHHHRVQRPEFGIYNR